MTEPLGSDGSVVMHAREFPACRDWVRRWTVSFLSYCPIVIDLVWASALVTVFRRKAVVEYYGVWEAESAFDAAFSTHDIGGWCESHGLPISRSHGQIVAFSSSGDDLLRFADLVMKCMRTVADTIHMQTTEPA